MAEPQIFGVKVGQLRKIMKYKQEFQMHIWIHFPSLVFENKKLHNFMFQILKNKNIQYKLIESEEALLKKYL